MSARNTRHNKKLRKLRKALRRQLPARIDVVQWLRDRGYANTAGEARRIILAGRLRSESHPVGRAQVGEDMYVVVRHQPASLRETLYVREAESEPA